MAVIGEMISFVDAQAATFISSKTALIAAAMQPAAVACMSIYIILYGFALLRGTTQTPMLEFVTKLIKMMVVFSLGVGMWHYNEYVVDTVMKTPDSLAAALGGSAYGSTTTALDNILEQTLKTGAGFWDQAGILKGNMGSYFAAFSAWGFGIAIAAYATFLVMLSKIFLSVLVAVGPLFITALFFETTSKFFESWVAQMANYGLTVVLVTAVNVFTMGMFESAATQAAAQGSSIAITDLFPFIVTAAVSLLVLAQVPSMASGLAGGIAMSSYGVGRMAAGLGAKAASSAVMNKGTKAAAKFVARKSVDAYKRRSGNSVKAAKAVPLPKIPKVA